MKKVADQEEEEPEPVHEGAEIQSVPSPEHMPQIMLVPPKIEERTLLALQDTSALTTSSTKHGFCDLGSKQKERHGLMSGWPTVKSFHVLVRYQTPQSKSKETHFRWSSSRQIQRVAMPSSGQQWLKTFGPVLQGQRVTLIAVWAPTPKLSVAGVWKRSFWRTAGEGRCYTWLLLKLLETPRRVSSLGPRPNTRNQQGSRAEQVDIPEAQWNSFEPGPQPQNQPETQVWSNFCKTYRYLYCQNKEQRSWQMKGWSVEYFDRARANTPPLHCW